MTRFSSDTVIPNLEEAEENDKNEDEETPTSTNASDDDNEEESERASRKFSEETSPSMATYDDDFDDTLRDYRGSIGRRRAPSTTDTGARQRYIFGRPLPLWCTTKPKWKSIATCIVKYAPCFWCSTERLSLTTTNQAILLRLNALTSIFAMIQVGSAVFLSIILWSETLVNRNALYVNRGRFSNQVNSLNLWSMNGTVLAAGALGVATFVGMICSRSSLRDIDLPGSIRFMWFLAWIIPIQIYLFVALFDYHNVTDVWIRHWWTARSSAWFRSNTCRNDTYNTLCVVPIDGLPLFDNETEWCEFYYNSTDCEGIRNEAQLEVSKHSYTYYLLNAVVGMIVFFLVRKICSVKRRQNKKPTSSCAVAISSHRNISST